MTILRFDGRQRQPAVQLRCYSCARNFSATTYNLTHCPQCAAGHGLYVATREYLRMSPRERGRS
jgi:Zn finger protein HypA/HybF involved in hydrogenase expression